MDVSLPDGTVIKDVPDGMSKADLTAKLKANGYDVSKLDAKFDPKVSNADYQANRFARGGAGILALPADVIYSAADIASRGLRAVVPGYEKAADFVNSLAPNFTVQRPGNVIRETMAPNMKAPSRGAEILGGVSEFAGAGALPSAAVLSRAAHLGPAIASEIGATVLGGVGSEVGGLPGAVVGSIVGANTPILASKAGAAASGGLSWLRGKSNSAAAGELATAIQVNPTSGANAKAVAEATEALKALGAGTFKPTLAQATGAPGIIAREQQVAAGSAEDMARYAARYNENAAVVGRAKDIAFPAGGSVSRAADTVKRRAIGELESRLDRLTAAQSKVAARLQDVPLQSSGSRLLELRNEAQNVARTTATRMIEDVYQTADRMGVRSSMDDIVDAAAKVRNADESTFQTLPPVYRKIFAEYGPKEVPMTGRSVPPDLMAAAAGPPKQATFKEVHSLWKEANAQYGAAFRVGDSQAQFYLQQVRNSLQSKLDEFRKGGYGELTDKFQAFNTFYSTKYAPAFREGVGGRMVASGRYGDAMKTEDIVGKFFNPTGIDDFNLIYQGDKAAHQALADGVINLFREKAVRGGTITPRAAEAFLRENKAALDKLPDIQAALQNPTALNAQLAEAAARTKDAAKQVNASALAKIAKTENIAPLVDRALTDRRSMAQLVAAVKAGGGGAEATLARTIAERVPEVAARQKIDPLTFVTQNEATLKPLLDRLGPSHYDNLLTIERAQAALNRTTPPTKLGSVKIPEAVEGVTGSSPRTVWNQLNAARQGRQSTVSSVLALLSRYGIKVREEGAVRMMREAIYDPTIAAQWADMAKGKAFTMSESNKFIDHLLASGIRVERAQQEQR